MKNTDWRDIHNGTPLPSESGYCDQPSIVAAQGNTLVGAITTGTGDEGAFGEYVGIIRSDDGGRNWTKPQPLEDPRSESSYGVLIADASGRIYCFYCYNLEGVQESDGINRRDMGGRFCFRYSDDCGLSWSARRIIPVRDFEIDRRYPILIRGKPYRMFWNVNAPFFDGDTLYIGLTKHHYGSFFRADYPYRNIEKTECVLLRCRGLARDPDAPWETLPEGEFGVRTPEGGGDVAEEPCFQRLSDGTIFMIARTNDGYPVCAYSRDGGRSFSRPFYPRHESGLPIKNCRAVTVLWSLGGGRYLLWFHNIYRPGYGCRNPVWCCPAQEVPGEAGVELKFGNPEILFYHPSEQISINYPSFFLCDGKYYVSETQKRVARVHELPKEFLDELFGSPRTVEAPDAFFEGGDTLSMEPQVYARLDSGVAEDWKCQTAGGTTFLFEFSGVCCGDTLFDTTAGEGGFRVSVTADGRLRCYAEGRKSNFVVESSVPVAGSARHRAAWVTDGAARVSYLVIDGWFDNGGSRFAAGWKYVPLQTDEIVCGAKRPISHRLSYLAVCSRPLTSAKIAGLFEDIEKNQRRLGNEKTFRDLYDDSALAVGGRLR